MPSRFINVYIVPAAVFVSVVMGGGYGTGREVVEFFTRYGLQGGLLGIVAASVAFALILAATFEFARVFRSYDYRAFFGQLIGPFWWLFELLYLLLFLLVLGVVSSAAGNILEQEFGIASSLGLGLMLLLVAGLVFFGREVLERILTLWSVGMYVIFALYFVQVLRGSGVDMGAVFDGSPATEGWLMGGLLYAMYNVAIAPVLLFSTRAISTRREALLSGLLTAVMVMVPALMFHASYAVGYPAVLDQAVPNYWMIESHAPHWLLVAFLVALFGTLVETGAGLVHGFIERIEAVLKPGEDDGLGHLPRAAIAVAALGASGLLGSVGIIALIGQGYSALAVGFALVYVLPVLTIGVYKIMREPKLHSEG